MSCQRSCTVSLVVAFALSLSNGSGADLESTVFDLSFALPVIFARPAPDLAVASLDFSQVLKAPPPLKKAIGTT